MANEDATETIDVDADLLEQQPPPKNGEDAAAAKTVADAEAAKASKPDELKTALADLAKHVKEVTAPPPEKEPELTQEQKDELWGVWNPTKQDPDFFRKFLRLKTDMDPAEVDAAVKEFQPLFDSMQKGWVRQAVVGARNLATIEFDKLRKEFKPLQDYVSTKRSEETRERFHKTYESLRDGKYTKVVDAIAQQLKEKEYDNEDAFFKDLAEKSADAIKGLDPNFDLGAGKTKTNKTAATTPKLPRTSVGSTGGVGSGVQKEPAATEDQSASVLD